MSSPSGPDQPSTHPSPAAYPPPDPSTARADHESSATEHDGPPPSASQPQQRHPSATPIQDQTGQYASFAPRVAAFAVDGVLAIAAGIAVAVIAGFAVRYVTFFAPAVRVFAYGTMIGVWLVQSYVQGETGQTLGKRMVGTRLVNIESGRPIGAFPSVRRGLMHAVDALPCGFGFFQVLWHTRRQTFADVLSRSVVVHG